MNRGIGKHHTYVGMAMGFNEDGSVEFSMPSHIQDTLDTWPEELSEKVSTPAGLNLFDIVDESERLDNDRAKTFNSIVPMLLFMSKRVRPDIQVTIALLCTRKTKSNPYNWKKLKRVLKYLKSPKDFKLHVFCSERTPVIKWWVDAFYAVQQDFKIHTGVMMTMGSGVLYLKSSKQKINTKGSIEAGLVAVSDMSRQILWSLYLIRAQSYEIKENALYQDNQSEILLVKNGELSCSQNTRHVNICYFFIEDKIENGDVQVVYCPTEDTVGDFFNKPLQGQKFIWFRNMILGTPTDYTNQEGIGTGNGTCQLKGSEF